MYDIIHKHAWCWVTHIIVLSFTMTVVDQDCRRLCTSIHCASWSSLWICITLQSICVYMLLFVMSTLLKRLAACHVVLLAPCSHLFSRTCSLIVCWLCSLERDTLVPDSQFIHNWSSPFSHTTVWASYQPASLPASTGVRVPEHYISVSRVDRNTFHCECRYCIYHCSSVIEM